MPPSGAWSEIQLGRTWKCPPYGQRKVTFLSEKIKGCFPKKNRQRWELLSISDKATLDVHLSSMIPNKELDNYEDSMKHFY